MYNICFMNPFYMCHIRIIYVSYTYDKSIICVPYTYHIHFAQVSYLYHICIIFVSYVLICIISVSYRRKFRSQTSDNMDRWKAEVEQKNREEKSRREKIREDRRKMQAREKVGKSRKTAFFQWFVAPEGRKVGSLKRRVRSQLARWEMKNCTPLWREAHFQVKTCKTHQARTNFGNRDV